MTRTILLLPAVLVFGVWLHELIHAATAVLLGGSVRQINLWQLWVDFSVPTAARERAVRHAPFVLGLCALPFILDIVRGQTALILAVALWAAITLTGGEGELPTAFVRSI